MKKREIMKVEKKDKQAKKKMQAIMKNKQRTMQKKESGQ